MNLAARLSLLFLFALGVGCSKPVDTRYVIAPSGLNLRSSPSPTGVPIKLARAASEVTVLEEQPELSTWQGLQGHWVRVTFEGSEGWMFGAFLSKDKPTAVVGDWSVPGCQGARAQQADPMQTTHFTYSFTPDLRFSAGGPINQGMHGTYAIANDSVVLTGQSVMAGYPSPFSETLIFRDGRLCDGSTCMCREP